MPLAFIMLFYLVILSTSIFTLSKVIQFVLWEKRENVNFIYSGVGFKVSPSWREYPHENAGEGGLNEKTSPAIATLGTPSKRGIFKMKCENVNFIYSSMGCRRLSSLPLASEGTPSKGRYFFVRENVNFFYTGAGFRNLKMYI